jgi:hypothetical protein
VRRLIIIGMLVWGWAIPSWADTLQVFPDPSSGATTVDGHTNHTLSGAVFDALRTGVGNSAPNKTATVMTTGFFAYSTTNTWNIIWRAIMTFDTSPLPDTATINYASVQTKGNDKSDPQDNLSAITLYSAAPAANNDLGTTDFSTLGSTLFSNTISYANFLVEGLNVFTINATGLATISKTGITRFGFRESNYDEDTAVPTWAAGTPQTVFRSYTADVAGTASDPFLLINYGLLPRGSPLILRNYGLAR